MISLESTYLYLLIGLLVQIIGFFIFLEYYIKYKRLRFFIIILGWLSNILGTIPFFLLGLLSNFLLQAIFYMVSIILASFGILFLSIGVMTYFIEVKKRIVQYACFLILIIPLIPIVLVEFGLAIEISIIITQIEQIIVLVTLIVIGIINRSKVMNFSKTSYSLFMITAVLALIERILNRFLESDLTIIANYAISVSLSIMLIIFLLHLEHSMSVHQKIIIKDTYSHDLAQLLQVIVGNLDLAQINYNDERITEAIQASMQASELLLRIRQL
ncbi:MAG: hypothetical protein ACFFCZ_13205 [Promethearchaeota archaeon]